MASKSYDKIVEEIGNLTVLELSDLVKALEDKFGVSAMPVASAAAGPAAGGATEAVAEEKSAYKVTLKDGGSQKIKVIKALRQLVPDLTLSDAKQKIESAPVVIAEFAPKDDAEKMKKELESAGAQVELA